MDSFQNTFSVITTFIDCSYFPNMFVQPHLVHMYIRIYMYVKHTIHVRHTDFASWKSTKVELYMYSEYGSHQFMQDVSGMYIYMYIAHPFPLSTVGLLFLVHALKALYTYIYFGEVQSNPIQHQFLLNSSSQR